MNKIKLNQFLGLLDAENIKTNRPPWVTLSCPLAGWRHEKGTDSNPSFGIMVNDTGPSRGHCFSCNWSGDLQDLVLDLYLNGKDLGLPFKDLRMMAEEDEEGTALGLALATHIEGNPSEDMYEFPEWWLASFPKVEVSPEGSNYLHSRKVPEIMWDEIDFRWDPGRKRVCVPIRDRHVDLYGLHGRSVMPDSELPYLMYDYEKHTNPSMWLGEEWVDWESPVLIVESMFDWVRALQVYRNTICPLTASLSKEKLKRVSDLTIGVTLFDGDKAGKDARYKLAKGVQEAHFVHVDVPEGTDPGAMPVGVLADLLQPYVVLDDIIA